MSRFEKFPKTIIGMVLILAFVLIMAAAEWLLTPDHGKSLIHGGDSLPRPERHLVLREWLPSSVFQFGVPDIRRLHPGGEVHDVYGLTTDSDGYITTGRQHDDADFRIVFLGGSTTECLYVTPKRRFPFRVGRILEQNLGVKINTINGGKSGNNTMHSMLALIGKVLPLKPDVVVLMQNVNDLGILARDGGYWTVNSDFSLIRERRRNLETIVKDLRDISIPYSYRAVRRVFRNAFSNPARAAGFAPNPRTAPTENLGRRGLAFENALRGFVGVAQSWGIRPVVMTQAQIGSTATGASKSTGDYLDETRLRRRGFTAKSFSSAHGYFNAIIQHVALSTGTDLIDLAKSDWTAEDLYDGLHFTDRGSERAARIIANTLAPRVRGRQAPDLNAR